MADTAQAAIKRATLAAQREVVKLDATVLNDLEQIYRQAAEDIAQRIAAYSGADGNVALYELQSVLDQVNARLKQLAQARDVLLSQSLGTAADLGTAPLMASTLSPALPLQGGGGASAALTSAAAMRINHEALQFVRTFVAEDGLQLSDRIWRLDRHARDVVTNAIESSVIQGHGATQAAREFLMRGEGVPADIADKIGAANAQAMGKAAGDVLTGTGSPMDNAMRLMRTEINRAHGEAYIKGALAHPDAAGLRFLLSPGHPKPDICDLHSIANLHGLGQGVYPDRASCPWPAHPNTISFVEVVFKDEITEADKAGKETAMQALARLTPEQRKGVLGVNKAEVFDQGKLSKGMIGSKWSAVKRRIDRTGDNTDNNHDMNFKPKRSGWNDFPDVAIHADESAVKNHPDYAAAKSGDIGAAKRLAQDFVTDDTLRMIRAGIGQSRPIVAAVQAIEESGENVIPTALGGVIAKRLGLELDNEIVQINRVGRTGSGGYYRLATQPLFDGTIEKGRDYLLVDDFIGQGGTLANLKGHIEAQGGQAVFATTLTGKPYSARLAPLQDTLEQLRTKHGTPLEDWWKKEFGYGFDRLTESEARYLLNSPDADTIRNRIAAAKQTGK